MTTWRERRRRRKGKADGGDCCLIDSIFDSPCFVATAAHGSEVAEPVRVLRAYRDQRLVRHLPGRVLARAYYRFGPYGARVLNRFPQLKPAARGALRPVVWAARRSLRR